MDNDYKYVCECGAELPPNHEGPCPECGESGKLHKAYEKSAHLTIGLVVSASAQKVHKYTKKHPWFISISVAFTIISLIVGYLVGGLVGLLIGIIVAMLNWWITPHAMKAIVEITHLGNREKEIQEAKAENDAQKPDYSRKGIYRRLGDIEKKIDYSSQTQKSVALYALGVAFIILGLSYYFAFLQSTGRDMTTFYSINIPGLLALGTFALVYASLSSKKKKEKGGKTVGTKGRKNVKKPKKSKLEKQAAKKK